MKSARFQEWIDHWWRRAENELNTFMPTPPLRVDASNSSAHFKTARGFAYTDTTTDAAGRVHPYIVIASKLLQQPTDRILGVLLHEIGHALDAVLLPTGLDNWAARHGRWLAGTPERRADDIVKAVFDVTIKYDAEDVQTIGPGVSPRPEELGL